MCSAAKERLHKAAAIFSKWTAFRPIFCNYATTSKPSGARGRWRHCRRPPPKYLSYLATLLFSSPISPPPPPTDLPYLQAIEDLDEAVQSKLEETNKRDSDLDPVLEALYGEELLKVEREAGEPEFIRRETCVKWLHVAGGY